MKYKLFLLFLLISIIYTLFKIVKIAPADIITKMDLKKEVKYHNLSANRNKVYELNKSNISGYSINETNAKNIIKINNYKIKKSIPKSEQMESGRRFLDKCLKGVLIDYSNNDKLNEDNENEILISVVIPVYNCEKTIKYAIRSVQNQNVRNIEIILVNDFSSDNTSKIIQALQNEDKRIKIINNNKNMGVLYSRSVGALSSKGKYFFTLDNDDMFFDSDILEIYKKAENEKYDIISFSCLNAKEYNATIDTMEENSFDIKQDNLVVSQPNLSIFPISKNGNTLDINDPHIWAKCIKNVLYKRAVNALGKERYSIKNNWNEDITIFSVICTLASNYSFIKKYGIFHHKSKSSASYSQNIFNLMMPSINFIYIILDFLPNNYKHFAALETIHLRKSWIFNISDNSIKQYLNSTINKILHSEFIDQNYKNRIKSSYKGIFF